jgi:hypothetical protein
VDCAKESVWRQGSYGALVGEGAKDLLRRRLYDSMQCYAVGF